MTRSPTACFLFLALLTCETGIAGPFDERLKLELGLSNSDLDGGIQVDSQLYRFNIGTHIDIEDSLGLSDNSSHNTHLRLTWQPKSRHRFILERLSFERRSDIVAANDFQYGDMSISAGASLDSRFDMGLDQYA